MTIGVGGASGQLGKAVLKELLARAPERKIVAISRTPDTVGAGVEARMGDYDSPDELVAAYAGLDVLLLIPTSDLRRGKRGAQNIAAVDAAVKAGVKHVVFMSGAGTREQAEPDIGASYWVGEQRLIQTAPQWTILRMNYYAESLAQEAAQSLAMGALTGIAENKVAFVSRDDVAAAAAGILLGTGHAGAIYNATGSRTYSGAERAELIASITGKPMGFNAIPAEQLRAGLSHVGLPEDVVNVVASIQTHFAAGAFDIVTGDVEKLSGRPPADLASVLAAHLG